MDIKVLWRQGPQNAAHSCAHGIHNGRRCLQCTRSERWIRLGNNHSRVQGTTAVWHGTHSCYERKCLLLLMPHAHTCSLNVSMSDGSTVSAYCSSAARLDRVCTGQELAMFSLTSHTTVSCQAQVVEHHLRVQRA